MILCQNEIAQYVDVTFEFSRNSFNRRMLKQVRTLAWMGLDFTTKGWRQIMYKLK